MIPQRDHAQTEFRPGGGRVRPSGRTSPAGKGSWSLLRSRSPPAGDGRRQRLPADRSRLSRRPPRSAPSRAAAAPWGRRPGSQFPGWCSRRYARSAWTFAVWAARWAGRRVAEFRAQCSRARPRFASRPLAEVASARADVPQVRLRLAAAIVAAYRGGARVGEIARVTGYGREQVRRILRAGGVEPEGTGNADG